MLVLRKHKKHYIKFYRSCHEVALSINLPVSPGKLKNKKSLCPLCSRAQRVVKKSVPSLDHLIFKTILTALTIKTI